MFRTLRAAFAMRSHTETWAFIKSEMINAGLSFPLQSDDYVSFTIFMNGAIEALPYAHWTRADYNDSRMIGALLGYISAEESLDLPRILRISQKRIEIACE